MGCMQPSFVASMNNAAFPSGGSNTVGDIEIEWKDGNPTHHAGPVTFCKVSGCGLFLEPPNCR